MEMKNEWSRWQRQFPLATAQVYDFHFPVNLIFSKHKIWFWRVSITAYQIGLKNNFKNKIISTSFHESKHIWIYFCRRKSYGSFFAILFPTPYLCKFSETAVIRSTYCVKINMAQEVRVAVFNLIFNSEERQSELQALFHDCWKFINIQYFIHKLFVYTKYKLHNDLI